MSPNSQSSIDSDAARKILDADLTNIVRKVQAGKPLTLRERTTVQAAAEVRPKARTQVELRAILGITRGVFLGLRKQHGSPTDLDIEAWREFISRTRSESVSERVLSPAQITNLRGQLLSERTGREKVERKLKELKLEREEGGWIPLEDAMQFLSRVLEPMNRLLDGIPKKYAMRVNPADSDHAEVMLREMVVDIKEQLSASRGAKISKRKGVK